MAGDHEGADVGYEEEKEDDVAVDAVKDEGVIAGPGDELDHTP